MLSIVKAEEKDFHLLAVIGITSFIESHGHSAKETDINNYVAKNYNDEIVKSELTDPKNIYYIIYHQDQPAGYSKIVFNSPHPSILQQNVTKLERLYLLKEFYGLQLGAELFRWNLALSKNNNQAGMWLFVWKENHRAVDFYKKNGFSVIGSYDFKISETHANPNHQLFLQF